MLVALLLIGLLLRVYFTVEWRPAITGYSDSGIYFQDVQDGPFADPFRTVGYGMFLSALHAGTPHLLLVTVVQHLLGLATGVLLYITVRHSGAPSWLGLLPAALVVLNGDQLFMEHSALTEALFTFLVVAMLYAAVRATDGPAWVAGVSGVCAGLAVTVREAGLALIPIAVLWIALSSRRPTRATLVRGGLVLALSLVVIGGYIGWRHAETGFGGLTTNDAWNLYGRVAPFADCEKFTAPDGTEELCESSPPETRANNNAYIFNPTSPAQRMLGPPYYVSGIPDAMEKLRSWSVAAILGQPLDYLGAVGDDVIRLVDPGHASKGDLGPDELIAFLLGGPDMKSGRNDFVAYWQHLVYPQDGSHHGDVNLLKDYEHLTRVDGVLMVVFLGLTLAAPWVVPRGPRLPARLLVAVALALILAPILTKGYDFRFTIPAVGPLAAAATLAGWGIAVDVRPRLRGTRCRQRSLAEPAGRRRG